MKKTYLWHFAILVSVSLMLTAIVYFINYTLLFSTAYVSSTDMLFVEGILFIILGILLILGSGGINLWSVKAAILGAATEAVYGEGGVTPSELFKRDSWKAKGFPRLGLVLLMAGLFMLVIYFISLAFR